MERDILRSKTEFPKWEGYKDLDKVKRLITYGCINDKDHVLDYAAKLLMEREYFKNMLLFVQERIQRYMEGSEPGIGLGIDSSKEIFEGLMLVPAEDVAFPMDHGNGDHGNTGVTDNNTDNDHYVEIPKE